MKPLELLAPVARGHWQFILKGNMEVKITRPQAGKKKISCKDDFELCYIRHHYFRRTTYNPTEEQMAPYAVLIKHIALNNFYTYKSLFQTIGLDIDDMISIGQIHLVNFLGLFSLEKNPDKLEAFLKSHFKKYVNDAKEEDILSKNKAIFTMFLKQRMEDLIRICRQKSKNVKGIPVQENYFFVGPNKPPRNLRQLFINHERQGFRKVNLGLYRAMKKKSKAKEPIFEFEGLWYVAVPLEKNTVTIHDFTGHGLDPYDNMHNMTPEQAALNKEEDNFWENKKKIFEDNDSSTKINILKKFIEHNKKNPTFNKEVRTARKVLKDLKAQWLRV